jgi:hypothetical protein
MTRTNSVGWDGLFLVSPLGRNDFSQSIGVGGNIETL